MSTETKNFSTTGLNPSVGVGQWNKITVTDVCVKDKYWQYTLTNEAGTLLIGANDWRSLATNFVMTYDQRIFACIGKQLNMSALDDPQEWRDGAVGAGAIELANQFSMPLDLVGLSVYQNKLAIFAESCILIYMPDANPNNFAKQQVLNNSGCVAGKTIQAFGNLDTFFLSHSGVFSLKTREAVQDALIQDIGSPINTPIRAKLAECTADEKKAACSVIDLKTNRYWLFIKDTIYVLSYFPDSKVMAWSKYLPTTLTLVPVAGNYNSFTVERPTLTYTTSGLEGSWFYWTKGLATSITNGTDTLTADGWILAGLEDFTVTGPVGAYNGTLYVRRTFVPKDFCTIGNMIYCRGSIGDADYLFKYGDGTYDATLAWFRTPWLCNNAPATNKNFSAIDAALTGAWDLQAGTNFKTGTLDALGSVTEATFQKGAIPFVAEGTHFQIYGEIKTPTAATVSNLIVHYESGDAS
jgi:hypothetical protein